MVALRKESVDRNTRLMPLIRFCPVALRKESVDRNGIVKVHFVVPVSLSARRAWIEIWRRLYGAARARAVALRKESVDRNRVVVIACPRILRSLSARRAWIEIFYPAGAGDNVVCRSPQGERG